jgi:cell division protein FtsB
MTEIEERKKFWHIFYSPLIFVVFLVLFLFMARAMWRVYNRERISTQDRERVENELAITSRREAVLKSQVETLQTTQGIDDEIRTKFNVAKIDEGVAVIVNSVVATSTATTSVLEKSWWQKFVGSFGG